MANRPVTNIVTWQDMSIDEVESGLPRLTLRPDGDDAKAIGSCVVHGEQRA